MAKNTSVNLGNHFETFITRQLGTGRFSSASEVMREGLRLLEERETKIDLLRRELAIGEEQAKRGEFVENFSYEALMQELDQETSNSNYGKCVNCG